MFEIERFHPNRRFMKFKTELHSEAQLVYGLAGGLVVAVKTFMKNNMFC